MRLLNGLIVFATAVLSSSGLAQSPPSTPPPTPLRVIAFDGGWNLPIWAAQRQGFFEANGVALQLSYTPTSAFLIQSLFDGRSDIAIALVDNLVAYQGTVGMARRGGAREHEAALVGFIRAYAQATDWLYDRANRDVAEALLVANIRDMTPPLAKQAYDILLADKGGLYRNLAPDAAGIRTVLELRSKYGTPQKTLTDPVKYIDLSYYEKASVKK